MEKTRLGQAEGRMLQENGRMAQQWGLESPSLAGCPEVLPRICPLCLLHTSASRPSGAYLAHLAATQVGWWKKNLFQ